MIKKMLALLLCLVMVFSMGTVVFASTNIPTEDDEAIIAPYADEIIYYYRTYDGRLQYRRWNATRGYWVDAYWIDVPSSR